MTTTHDTTGRGMTGGGATPARTPSRSRALACVTVLAIGLAGCTPGGPGDEETGTTDASRAAATPTTLRVLAGSEVRDMEPVLEEAKKATGVTVVLSYAGTLEGAEQVASGKAADAYDATWFSSNRYLGLLPGGNQAVAQPVPVMSSPVVLGVRESSAKRLGWDTKAPSWAEIGAAAKAGTFTFGMTNPASSNSGFSALVGVATALTGGGKAIDPTQVKTVTPQLTSFFSGQKLTSGSSGWLADRFVEQAKGAQPVDGLINYESVVLDLDARNGLPDKLRPVYPADGVVSADYPLSLLAKAPDGKRESFTKLTDWLRTPDAQRLIMQQTHRRPVVPGVAPAPEFGKQLLVELPFPAQRAAADGLIAAYLHEAGRPSQTVYVLDTSGSMEGERIAQLKQTFARLSGKDVTDAQAFARFRNREQVTLLPFNTQPGTATAYDVPASAPDDVLGRIDASVAGLKAGGDTALYDALLIAYKQALSDVAAHPDTFTSIVLMTDGERTAGRDLAGFKEAYAGLGPGTASVPTFTVLFGDSSEADMKAIADLTHGKVFDARKAPLDAVFREIRGYQ